MTDRDWQGAIDVLEPLRASQPPNRDEFYRNWRANAAYIHGYCLVQLGAVAEGEALIADNKPLPWVIETLQNGLPGR